MRFHPEHLIVAAAVLVNLWLLSPEARPAPPLNDGVLHLGLTMRAAQTMTTGESPLDHWNANWVLGFPVFQYYQHLPHLLVAGLHRALGDRVALTSLFNLTFYVVLAALPIGIYGALRLLEFGPLAAALASACAPFLSSSGIGGFDYASYVWRGSGMFTQAWGMSLFPLSVGAASYTMRTGRRAGLAVAAVAVTIVSHVIYGYMAVLSIAVMAILPDARTPLPRRIVRVGFVLSLAAVAIAYFLVPRVLNGSALSRSVWIPTVTYDSYGHEWVLRAIATGDLLDFGRLPIVTLLAAVGLAHAIVRRQPEDRAACGLFVVWLALFFGRPTWGALYQLLPLSSELHIQRFIGGVHFASIALAGLGFEQLLSLGQGLRRRGAIAAVAIAVLVSPVVLERYRYMMADRAMIDRNAAALQSDRDDLEKVFAALRDGQRTLASRVYAGLPGSWGRQAPVGEIPMYALLSLNGFDLVGYAYHAMSYGADVQYHFNDQEALHYNLFNVGWVVAPRTWTPPGFLERTFETPQWLVYRAPSQGYFSIADAPEIWSGRPRDVYRTAVASLPTAATQFAQNAGAVRAGGAAPPSYDAIVDIVRPGHLVFKMTHHPWWRVSVDGRARALEWVAPGFMAVAVAPGDHHVEFTYRPAAYKTWLLVIGVLVSVVVSSTPGFWRRWLRTQDPARPPGRTPPAPDRASRADRRRGPFRNSPSPASD